MLTTYTITNNPNTPFADDPKASCTPNPQTITKSEDLDHDGEPITKPLTDLHVDLSGALPPIRLIIVACLDTGLETAGTIALDPMDQLPKTQKYEAQKATHVRQHLTQSTYFCNTGVLVLCHSAMNTLLSPVLKTNGTYRMVHDFALLITSSSLQHFWFINHTTQFST